MSTAAHHASALTLTAGLGGGRAARRGLSLSRAEYDPERPLHAMIAGVSSKHSLFDCTKNTVSTYTCQDENALSYLQTMGMTYDPVVVDNTAELDRILEWPSRCKAPFTLFHRLCFDV